MSNSAFKIYLTSQNFHINLFPVWQRKVLGVLYITKNVLSISFLSEKGFIDYWNSKCMASHLSVNLFSLFQFLCVDRFTVTPGKGWLTKRIKAWDVPQDGDDEGVTGDGSISPAVMWKFPATLLISRDPTTWQASFSLLGKIRLSGVKHARSLAPKISTKNYLCCCVQCTVQKKRIFTWHYLLSHTMTYFASSRVWRTWWERLPLNIEKLKIKFSVKVC